MRIPTILLMAALITSCYSTRKSERDLNELNGIWIPIQQEIGGHKLPAAAYEKYRLTLTDSIYTYGTGKIDRGVATYHNGRMDIYGKEGVNAGKHYTAIYRMDKGQLTICYNLAGDSYPEAFDTKNNPTLFLSIFKKDKEK